MSDGAGSERERIEALERRVALLEAAIRALPQQAAPVVSAATAPTAPSAPRVAVPTPKRDWEALIGRYGILVLATVAALGAVGTFIGWAIANGYLGPTQRVVLGLIVAFILGMWGLRLRRRERSFGSTLLGLALAMVHVCAWGMGPALHLAPQWAAFGLAALASIALGVFAHTENDEPLWCVGFFGAAIAPFVTSDGRGSLPLLAAYGVGVLVSGGIALNGRTWKVAGRLFLVSAMLYATALALGEESKGGPLLAMGFPIVVAYLGVVRWSSGWTRRDRLRALAALAGLAALRASFSLELPVSFRTTTGLIAAVGVAWLVLLQLTFDVADAPDRPVGNVSNRDWLEAGIIPLAFPLSALTALSDHLHDARGYAMAVGAAAFLVTLIRYPSGSLRDAAAAAGVVCAAIAIAVIGEGHMLAITTSIAVLGFACFVANVWRQSDSWMVLGGIGLGWSMLSSLGELNERGHYAYAPFATQESAVAAAVLAAAFGAWRLAFSRQMLTITSGGAIIWAFVWVHQEIAFAFNATAATLLRVTYYAATSAAAVGVGRARGHALLRHAGLGLAVIAAGTALYGARNLSSVAARIAADLVAAVFLLGIAWWYRRPGASPQAAEQSTGRPSSTSPSDK